MSAPRSIRFDPSITSRLQRFVREGREPSASAAVNRLVDEGLRMEEHPGVHFRTGPSGRRAVLIGGPDVWEVVRSVRSSSAAEPQLDPDEVLALVVTNTGAARPMIEMALAYWADHPGEIDAMVEGAERAEVEFEEGLDRRRDLLTR